jgi:hypothetical protein
MDKIWERRTTYNILIWNLLEKRPLGKWRNRREDYFKTDGLEGGGF